MNLSVKTGKRRIIPGTEFDHLFPKAKGDFVEVKKFAALNDTVGLMKEVIRKTSKDTELIAQKLKANTLLQTCRNIWSFCFNHLQYEKDEANIEQVRRPARSWKDRFRGVDCDCLTVFICSILTNLKIPFLIRITKYDEEKEFEHVYPVALNGNQTIILDTVVHQFNYEVPYFLKKDITMKLQYLNGFEDDDEFEDDDQKPPFEQTEIPEDAEALFLMDSEELEGLEGKAQRQARKEKRQEKREEKKENKPPLKDRIKKGLNVVNKVNPVTALLRAGILASLKLNVGKVAGKLRYSYWTESQATANQMEVAKYRQLVDVRKKLENIFYGAGGNANNLKKAVLEGKGNNDKRVALNGLGELGQAVSDYYDLPTIIGHDTYFDEFDDLRPTGSMNGLGEPVSTTAAIAAASGVIGTIAALIKKIGSLFKKGSPQEQKEILADNTADAEEKTRPFSIKNIANSLKDFAADAPEISDKLAPIVPSGDELVDQTQSESEDSADEVEDETPTLPAITDNNLPDVVTTDKTVAPAVVDTGGEIPSDDGTANNSTGQPKNGSTGSGFGQWVKDHPYTTIGLVIAAFGLGYLGYQAYQKNKKPVKSLSGVTAAPKKGKKRKAAHGGIGKVKLL